ncbi:MAG: peptidyl-prolyl cis-trans isomerase [Acidobacteriota bacterium]|nr:peptidyl-prolyl cis-trans isomerase [Acidobacteriota bacterium]
MNTNPNNDNELENEAESALTDEVSAEVKNTEEDIEIVKLTDVETPTVPTDAVSPTVVETEEFEKVKAVSASASSTQNAGMSALTKGAIVIGLILAIGAGLLFWKDKVGALGEGALTNIGKEEMQILLKDADPMQLKALAESPDGKKKISENLKQLLAVAGAARKEGLANDPNVQQELENIRTVITASIYDQKINKDKGAMPQFGHISEDQVKEFWGENESEPGAFQSTMDKIGIGWITANADKRRHEAEFQKFLDSKLALARESGKFPKDKELTEEETKQAKDDFAKIKIYEEEAKEKAGELGGDFKREVELQVKLQQAQFLAGIYADKILKEKVKVSDEDVKKYIAEHPEFDPKEKRATAEQILSRAKAGEDFVKLANEFTQDPGNKNPKGELQGGLYKDVPKGQMVPAFEQAALSLEPGKIADSLVETPYGFHIIKLEKKGEGKDASGNPAETYDVRHILITTTVKDTSNPMGREMPVSDMVKAKLEKEKQKTVLDEIVANNPVEVAEDFEIPQVSEEQMQQMMQQQMMQQQMMQPQPPSAPTADAPKTTKPETKKK